MLTKKVIDRLIGFYFHIPIEAIIWITGLILLALYHPQEDQHISICYLNNLGFKYCPGCGLGRSVSFLLHGQISNSLESHPLGFIAIGILSFRIFQLIRNYIRNSILNKPYYG